MPRKSLIYLHYPNEFILTLFSVVLFSISNSLYIIYYMYKKNRGYYNIFKMARKRKQPEITDDEEIEKIASSIHKRNIKLKKISLTDKQLSLLKIIFDRESKIIFISGPAGINKTYVAIYGALQLYNMNNEHGITYVRTIAESGEKSLGALLEKCKEN